VAPPGRPAAGFGEATIVVGGEPWPVLVADTEALRHQGLRGVAGLGGERGMLFVFQSDSEAAFTMADTLIPLDIAFFAADGSLVDSLSMVPCTGEPCPDYPAAGRYRYALEVPAGGFRGSGDLKLDPLSIPGSP
jgi:uncharacterized membrane protein (UPF0127 family)